MLQLAPGCLTLFSSPDLSGDSALALLSILLAPEP